MSTRAAAFRASGRRDEGRRSVCTARPLPRERSARLPDDASSHPLSRGLRRHDPRARPRDAVSARVSSFSAMSRSQEMASAARGEGRGKGGGGGGKARRQGPASQSQRGFGAPPSAGGRRGARPLAASAPHSPGSPPAVERCARGPAAAFGHGQWFETDQIATVPNHCAAPGRRRAAMARRCRYATPTRQRGPGSDRRRESRARREVSPSRGRSGLAASSFSRYRTKRAQLGRADDRSDGSRRASGPIWSGVRRPRGRYVGMRPPFPISRRASRDVHPA